MEDDYGRFLEQKFDSVKRSNLLSSVEKYSQVKNAVISKKEIRIYCDETVEDTVWNIMSVKPFLDEDEVKDLIWEFVEDICRNLDQQLTPSWLLKLMEEEFKVQEK